MRAPLVDVDQNKAGTCPWAQMQVQPTRRGARCTCVEVDVGSRKGTYMP